MFQFIGPSRTLTMLRPLHRRDAVRSLVDGTGYWPYRYAPSTDAQRPPPPPEQVRPPKPVGECMVPARLLDYALLDKVSPTLETDLDPTAVRRPGPPGDAPPVDPVKARADPPVDVPAFPRRFQEIQEIDHLLNFGVLEPMPTHGRAPCYVAGEPPPPTATMHIHDDPFLNGLIDPYAPFYSSSYKRFSSMALPDDAIVPIFTTYKPVEDGLFKSISIWDARFANFTSPFTGRPFSLYNFFSIWQLLACHRILGHTIAMAKSDWQNFYPSIVLPRALWHYTRSREFLFRTRRGIFGSSWMPALGQALNVSLFEDTRTSSCECQAFQIIDDTIIISLDGHDEPCHAHTHCKRMMSLGEDNGLLEAKSKREMISHGESVVFAGKTLSADGIGHPISSWFASVLWFLQFDSLSPHMKRVFMGRANWVIAHQPLARPFLNTLYPGDSLQCRDPFIMYNIFAFLALAAIPRSTHYGVILNTPATVRPNFDNMNRPFIFVDSSFADGLTGIILQTPKFTKAIRFTVPACFRQDQQSAELFGVLMALKLAVRFSFVNPVVVGDNQGSLFSLLSMKAPTRRWRRLSLLQSISKFFLKFGSVLGYISVKWLPGALMPADILSRNFSLKIGKIFQWDACPARVLKKISELPPPPDVKASRPPPSVWLQNS